MSMRYQWLIIPSILALTVAGSRSLIPKHVYIDPDVPDLAVREGDDLILRCKARVLDTTDVQLNWTHGSRKRMRQSVTKRIEENKEDSSWTYQTELLIRNFTAKKQGHYRCKLFIGWSYSTHSKIRIFLSSGPYWHDPDRNRGIRVDTVKERKRENSSGTSNVYFVAIAPGVAVVMVIVGIAVFFIYRHKQSQRSTSSWSALTGQNKDSSDRLYAEPEEVKACPAHGHVDPVRHHQYYNIHQGRPIVYF